MRRYFLRPLFNFHDPFFPIHHTLPTPTLKLKINRQPTQTHLFDAPAKNDPHALFNQFFKQHELKHQTEKEFFQKHFPEKVEEKFDPFKVLEINKDATVDQVKDAYRNLAIKYHPKNNTDPKAEEKFAEVAKAYETIIEGKKNRQVGDLSFNSFFEQFEKQVEQAFAVKKTENKETKDGKTEKVKEGDKSFGDLYSESSNYQSVNGQQTKYVIEKVYKKDGKLVSVKREQKLKDDGKVQITETIDNGKQIKKKTFQQESDVKKIAN